MEPVKPEKKLLVDVLIERKLAVSRSAARRLISQGGVKVDSQTEKDPLAEVLETADVKVGNSRR